MSPIPQTDIDNAWPYYDSYAKIIKKLADTTLYPIREITFICARNSNIGILYTLTFKINRNRTIREAYNQVLRWLTEPLPKDELDEFIHMNLYDESVRDYYKLRGDCLGNYKIIKDIIIINDDVNNTITLKIETDNS